MLCEHCNKKEAVIHLSEIIQDVRSDVHLCEDCAKKIGINSKESDFSFSLQNMLSFIELDDSVSAEEEHGAVCRVCGTDFAKYAKLGKVGCPDCYVFLEKSLSGVISGYHGDKTNIGKTPRNWQASTENWTQMPLSENIEKTDELSFAKMREALTQAVAEERYEDAAVLRDKINQAARDEVSRVVEPILKEYRER